MKLKERLADLLVYSGVSREDYRTIRQTINEQNRRIMKSSVLPASLLLVLLFFASLVTPTISHNRVLYLLILLALLLQTVSSRLILQHLPTAVPIFCYLFLEIFYCFAIILGTFQQPDMPATSFAALLFIAPLLFIDMPWRMSLFMGINTLFFCACSNLIKTPELASLDRVNMLSILFIAILINGTMTRIRVRERVSQHYIEQQKDRDTLTGLLNKTAFELRVRSYIRTSGDSAALLIFDVDSFKSINDTYGHAYGDTVLRLLGEYLQQMFRGSDYLGRFGGDEFIIFLPHLQDRQVLTSRVQALTDGIAQRFELPDRNHYVQISIGIAWYPRDAASYEALFEKSDHALYQAKRNGKNQYLFFDQL